MENLVDKLLKASSLIHNNSIYGSGNYIVTSPDFAQYIFDIKRKEIYERRKRIIDKLLKDSNM